MRTFSRIGLVSTLFFAVSPALAINQPASNATITAANDDHPFALKDAKGHYLALHFLPAGDTPEDAAFVREYLKAAPTAAGVVHAFIRPQTGDAKAWASQFADASRVFVDHDSKLAADLGVWKDQKESTRFATTVVLDQDGKELFRLSGTPARSHVSFGSFASRLDTATRHAALTDYNLPKGQTLAVEGYDVVAYIRVNKAVKGKPELTSRYRGVNYQFSSDENRALFAADPEKYLPTYGGWCATAMGAKGEKVEIDPTNFKVTHGRLFLFYKSILADAQKDWNKHEKEWEPAADTNWKKLTNEDPIKPAN